MFQLLLFLSEQFKIEGFDWPEDHRLFVLKLPNEVIQADFRMRVHADLDVALETFEELKVDLKRPLMVLRIDLDRMGMHRQDLNLAAQFRDKKLNIFSSGHK